MPKVKKKYLVCVVETDQEVKVRKQVKRKTKIEDSKEIGRILICKHLETKIQGGIEITRRVKSYPDYLICSMIYSEESFHHFKQARGFITFLPTNDNPTCLETKEAARILIEQSQVKKPLPKKKPKPFQLPFKKGDMVLVKEGAFAKLEAKIVKINYPEVEVEILILGQPIKQVIRWHYLKPLEKV